jgi:hypothetical protein
MKKLQYKPTKLFYFLIGSLLISLLISPIAFGIVGGFWGFYGLINLGNKVNEDNRK